MLNTKEIHFETTIETDLINQGFIKSEPSGFNRRLAIDESQFWAFLADTQQKTLDEFIRLNPSD